MAAGLSDAAVAVSASACDVWCEATGPQPLLPDGLLPRWIVLPRNVLMILCAFVTKRN